MALVQYESHRSSLSKSTEWSIEILNSQECMIIIIHLLTQEHYKSMIATQLTIPKPYNYHSDSKSQASTQGEENHDYHAEENFVFPTYGQMASKTVKSKVKSSLCKNFTEKGFCPYGSKCQFAHGTHQLRINMDLNNSYKTKPCNAFFKKGHCQYGYRCNFVHSEPSSVSNEIKWEKIYQNHRETVREAKVASGSRLLRILA